MSEREFDESYRELMMAWKTETAVPSIQEIKFKERFIPRIKSLIHHLYEKEKHTSNPMFKEIFKEYIVRINFLMEDIFEERFKKILAHAQQDLPVNEENLFPFEVEYYKSINLGFRGYSKAKRFVLNPDQKMLNDFLKADPNILSNIENGFESIQNQYQEDDGEDEILEAQHALDEELGRILDKENELIQSEEVSNSMSEKSQEIHLPTFSEDEIDQFIEDEQDIIPNMPEIHDNHESTPDTQEEIQIDRTESIKKLLKTNIDYTLIRILGEVPELVGEDLRIYGPFYSQQIVNLPKSNAEIIISERKAEKLEPIF